MSSQPASDILVSAREVSRSFMRGGTNICALAPTTCAIRSGERIAVMGPSGSGKSTLLHLLAGLDLPSSGSLQWPALGDRDHLRPGKVGVAFQSASLVPFLTVAENAALPLSLLGESRDAMGEAAAALERFGLAALADRLPEEISGGQAQRVALARAIATRPRLVAVDEPTGQLDRATARSTIQLLLDWATATGAALLVTTHDLEVGQALETIWPIDHGRVKQADGA